MNFDVLLARAKVEWLDDATLRKVAKELGDPFSKENKYTLLHIIGKGTRGNKYYREIVESYLRSKEDTMLTRLALKILCSYWGYTDQYLTEIRRFLEGGEWDIEDDCKLIAVSIAGEYLRKNKDIGLLAHLLYIFEDDTEDSVVRQVSYDAIARATGHEWSELPSAARPYNWTTDINLLIIQEAKERLIAEGK